MSKTEIGLLPMYILVFSESSETHWVNISDFTEQDEIFYYTQSASDKKDGPVWKKRHSGIQNYPTMGFSGTVFVGNCETYSRLKHFLDLQLQISIDEVKMKLENYLKMNPNPPRILWTRKSLYEFGTRLENDEWLLISSYPDQFNRDNYNEVLKRSGSSWRLKTPKIERLLKLESLKELEKLRSEIGSETKTK